MSKKTDHIPNTPLKFVWFLGSKYKALAICAFTLVFLAETFNVLVFYVSAQLIDNFTLAGTLPEQKEVLLFWGGLFLFVSVANSVCYRLSGFVALRWIIRFHKDGYNVLYKHLSKHSHTYFVNRFGGALSNKVSNAVDSSAGITFQLLWTFFSEFVGVVVTIALFYAVNVWLGTVLVVMLLIVLMLNIYAVQKRRPLVVEYAEASSKARGEGVDAITNISAVRQYVRHRYELSRLSGVFENRATKDARQAFFGEWIMVMNTAMSFVITSAVLVMLYVLLTKGAITAGTLVLVLGLIGRVGYMFIVVGQALNRFVRDYGNIEEGLKEILVPHEITDIPKAKKLKAAGGEIEWKDVNFSFDNIDVFTDFNMTIAPGQRLGLVGHSGAGKTTFVSLLLRQHEINDGSIMIDGQDIAKVTQDSLRSNITVVPQEPMLFHRTIKENILYGKPNATMAEVIEVAKKAQAHEFIEKLSDGYDTLVGERGVKLSGGQKQRVAIARAMLKDAPILLLDEATSALDSESEVLIQRALETLMEGKTVIAIAHRLSTLRKMDRIIVLEDGVIKEDGDHESLSNGSGVYQQLWEHQAGGFITD